MSLGEEAGRAGGYWWANFIRLREARAMPRVIIMTGTLALLMGLMLFGLGIGERIHAGGNLDGAQKLFVNAAAPDSHDPSGNPSIVRAR